MQALPGLWLAPAARRRRARTLARPDPSRVPPAGDSTHDRPHPARPCRRHQGPALRRSSATFARLPRIDEVSSLRRGPARCAVRRRRLVPAGREVRAQLDPPGVAPPAAGVPPGAGRLALRRAPGGRRRRRAVQPVRHRRTRCSRSTTASPSCWPRAADPVTARRRPHDRARRAARGRAHARPGGADPLRCPPRHLEQLLRGRPHPRHDLPARPRGGPAAAGRVSSHVGIRGPLYAAQDLVDDASFGFEIVRADRPRPDRARRGRRRRTPAPNDAPVYLSIDIDVLDPAFAPGTGTPEMGGLTSRELLALVRALPPDQIVAADLVEVEPAVRPRRRSRPWRPRPSATRSPR